MTELTAARPASRADRREPGYGERGRGTSGVASGTNGALGGGLVRAYLAIAALVFLVDGVNVLTLLDDAHRRGEALTPWAPITWEFTSGVATLAVCAVIYGAIRLRPPGQGRWLSTLLVHAGGTVVFSGLHVGLMALLRFLIDGGYRLEFSKLPYEYRKDVLAYLVLAGLFWLFARPARAGAQPPQAAVVPVLAPTFDIVDGARTLRVPAHDILSLRAAGNYVEFILADGRKPLMRASLTELEAVLEPLGFVRTHRSWIVNGRRLRGLEPAGSGDFHIELDGGTQAPLSRRFPAALARLRAGEGETQP
jgi:hypothetical protein